MFRKIRNIFSAVLCITLVICIIGGNINVINPAFVDAKAEDAVKSANVYYGTYSNLSQAVENGEISIDYEVGDTFQFGSYPQSKVTDETTEAELNSLYPFNKSTWTDYGYYGKENENAEVTQLEYMYYIDVTLDSVRYRGVRFDYYRPSSILSAYSTSYTNSTQHTYGYDVDTVYWFKYDPVKWKILDSESGFAMSNGIIDSQPFNKSFYYDGENYYLGSSGESSALDYSKCSLRNWLNEDFYNTAFDSTEQEKISTTTFNLEYNASGNSKDVTDKIFLLSQVDINNNSVVFASEEYKKTLWK